MFNKYYLDELSFLRELGREFAQAYPDAAPHLAEAGSDPDVERLLEGFAFLTGRIRQKLDDEIPEFIHAMVEMFWPHYLRPIPSCSIVQFEPLPQAAKEVHHIEKGVELESIPVDGTPCRFRTTADVTLVPLTLKETQMRTGTPPSLTLKLGLPDGVGLDKLGLKKFRLYFSGGTLVARALYLSFCRYLHKVTAKGGSETVELTGAKVEPAGLADSEPLLSTGNVSFPGFRLMQEYFSFPEKLMFVEISGLKALERLVAVGEIDLTFHFTRIPDDMPPISDGHVLLNCAPVVNIFKHDADPIRVAQYRTEYKVRPSGSDPNHYEIHSIDTVAGLIKGTAKPREYLSFFKFARTQTPGIPLFRARSERAVVGEGTDVYLTFLNNGGGDSLSDIETISVELTCTNRQLPRNLKLGDLSVSTSTSPGFARFRNIMRPTPSVPPPLEGDLYWRLLSHLSLNYLSLTQLESLRSMLTVYNFKARVDKREQQELRNLLDGIINIKARPATQLYKGSPVRGMRTTLELHEEKLGGEGGVYLFGVLFNEFLAQYVTLNAFSQLTVQGTKYGEVHKWPPRLGKRTIL